MNIFSIHLVIPGYAVPSSESLCTLLGAVALWEHIEFLSPFRTETKILGDTLSLGGLFQVPNIYLPESQTY